MNMRLLSLDISFIGFMAMLLVACEEPFIPENLQQEPQLVVEGYIEAGDLAPPPYVILTRTFPFLSEISPDKLNKNYVRGARVTVKEGSRSIPLTELCLDNLPPLLKKEIAQFLGFDVAEGNFIPNACLYADLNDAIQAVPGKTYTLDILIENKRITASATIPVPVALDSLRFIPSQGVNADSFLLLTSRLADPERQNNFYRYQVRMGDGPFITPGGGSLFDDRLFNGQNFRLNLPRPGADGESFNIRTFGLYPVGRQTTIRWVNLDRALFDFWNTLEFSINNQGPFSTYTRVKSNVTGALGVWGGLQSQHYSLTVKK